MLPSDLLTDVVRGLFFYTLAHVLWSAIRRRDPHRFDVVWFLGALAILPLTQDGSIWSTVLRAALPLFALLVVRHFRTIPAPIPYFAWAVPTAVALGGLFWGFQALEITRWALPGYLSAGMFAAAGCMIVEGRRMVGVQARRMFFVAAGTCCLAVSFAAASVLAVSPLSARLAAVGTLNLLTSAAMIGYFLGFATPRWIAQRWQRTEQAAHLAHVSEREPEERGWLAAEDLVDGVERCVVGATVFVARPHPCNSRSLVVRAASERALLGAKVNDIEGPIGRVWETGEPAMGPVSDCESGLAGVLAPFGTAVLAAPIVADAQSWGVVVAIHGRGALFPNDDLAMLAKLARNAAIAFDHAALIVNRRDQARQAADARLRELESRVGLMLDSIKDYAMLVLDEQGLVAAWHTGAQHVFGHAREQIAHQPAAPLFEMDAGAFRAWLASAARDGVAEREGACRRLDGTTFTGATTVRPLVNENAAPPGFVVVTRDVTEQRALQERLRQGEKMQAIGQLAGGIAHDFNNLLTAILGYTDWLSREMAGDPRAEQLREIQAAAERAADLTRQLLAFSRRQVVQATSIDLSLLVQGLVPMVRRLIGRHVVIADRIPPCAPVWGDRGQVEQIILNLVLNARDAMPEGGRITLTASEVDVDASRRGLPAGRYVRLDVQDTGTGMDQETRRRAFEPFFTTKEPGRGTGLGLATVYSAVQQMGGLVEIDSAPGQGATFRVFLPRANQPAVSAGRVSGDVITSGRGTLLLIEDDDALRSYLVHVLEGHGYDVIQADGPYAALSASESEPRDIDLVISDVVMPGMSGPEVVAELLQMRPGLPRLYISGVGEDDEAGEQVDVAPGPLLHKPFSSTDLLTKVQQILSVA